MRVPWPPCQPASAPQGNPQVRPCPKSDLIGPNRGKTNNLAGVLLKIPSRMQIGGKPVLKRLCPKENTYWQTQLTGETREPKQQSIGNSKVLIWPSLARAREARSSPHMIFFNQNVRVSLV